jgi:hypothetical protein
MYLLIDYHHIKPNYLFMLSYAIQVQMGIHRDKFPAKRFHIPTI